MTQPSLPLDIEPTPAPTLRWDGATPTPTDRCAHRMCGAPRVGSGPLGFLCPTHGEAEGRRIGRGG